MDRNSGTAGCHLVALPYPGRGHINPMMNFCKLLVSKLADTIKITFVVTEEWLAFVESEPRPPQIQLRSLPNVIPSELVRGSDHSGFFEAVCTKMEAPFEQLLDQVLIENTTPVVQVNAMIIADTLLSWAVSVGSKRNIPLVSLWTMSPTVFSFFYHFDVLTQNRHFCDDVSAEREDELIDYIPGISPTRLADMPKLLGESRHLVAGRIIEAFTSVRKAQCLLLASFDELEPEVNESLRGLLPFPVFSVGPCIPHTQVHENTDDKADNGIVDKADNGIVSSAAANANSNIIINMEDYYYLEWLDSQPKSSVLYVSFGSFLSFSREQMDEILAGLRLSGVRYLLVSRGDHIPHTSGTSEDHDGVLSKSHISLVVPWCDQLRVLCHSSVGGFWTHCGWNSTLEAVFAGVPMLTFPVGLDQFPNRKLIVDDWKVGMRVVRKEEELKSEGLVNREEVKTIVKRFMDMNGNEGIGMRRRANELKESCRRALAKDGSLETNVNAFITDTLQQIAHDYQ